MSDINISTRSGMTAKMGAKEVQIPFWCICKKVWFLVLQTRQSWNFSGVGVCGMFV